MRTAISLARQEYIGVEAFEDIYQCYMHVVKRSVCRILRSDRCGEVEDVVQETWLKAYKALRDGKTLPLEAVPGWFNRIATNTAIDALRKQRQIKWFSLSSLNAYQNGETVSHYEMAPPMYLLWLQTTNEGSCEYRVIERERIERVARQLSPNEKTCLWLYECGGFSCKEIASLLQISEPAVKMRLRRARNHFKRIFSADSEEQ